MLTHRFTLLVLLSALLAACAPQPVPDPTDVPAAEATATEAPMVSTLPVQPTTQSTPEPSSANGAWAEYRDPRYGIGLAYPCWWVMNPIPAEGSGGALSLRSFDEVYFRANSVKGQWKDGVAPEGVYAADFLVFEGIDPAASNADAYAGLIDPSMEEIVSSEDTLIGQNQATVIQLQNLVNSNDPLFTAILFRLAPDKLMIFVTQQQDRLDSADAQGILNSLSLSPDQPIVVPAYAPHPPLIAAACLSQ
jgi:hypothetical protein